MQDKFDSEKLYVLDGFALNTLMRIADKLGSGERMSDDQRRDCMNIMVCRLNDAILYKD